MLAGTSQLDWPEYTDGKLISQTDGTNVWWFYYDADGTRLAMEYNGEMYYYEIEYDDEYETIADAFVDRLEDYFEIDNQ